MDFQVVDVLASKGVNMVPFQLDYTVDSAQGILNFTMDVDMLAHFDEWQRAGLDDAFEAQDQWPFELRRARVIPAVDYLQVSDSFFIESKAFLYLFFFRGRGHLEQHAGRQLFCKWLRWSDPGFIPLYTL